MSGLNTFTVHDGSSKHLSVTVKEEHSIAKPSLSAHQSDVLAQYYSLWLRIRNFEKDEQLRYRLKFLQLEEQGLLKPEQYESVLARTVWHVSEQAAPAVLSFPQMYKAKAALAELEGILQFANSEGICEGCTANNVRCEAVPRRQGHCMMHVSQAGKCKAIDQVSKHRCEQVHEARDLFCEQHRMDIQSLLNHGCHAIEDHSGRVAEAQKIIDRIIV